MHIFKRLCCLIKRSYKMLLKCIFAIVVLMFIALGIGKTAQYWDKDPDRGAIAIDSGYFDESYTVPVYLEQGWSPAESLWFYNTTQGSDLIPYDFFLALEIPNSEVQFNSSVIYDKYRYLPQKPTFINPDGLAVGFTKDTYKGKDYIGYTCAACHTGQLNYKGKAIRIDGGPSMADMVGYLTLLERAMKTAIDDPEKQARFVDAVIAQNNDYDSKDEILQDLQKWTDIIQNYNMVNHSELQYGYARLDAFGRIYNRVLQHVINKKQSAFLLQLATKADGSRMLTAKQVDLVLKGVDDTVIGNQQFGTIIRRLLSTENGYPGLDRDNMYRLREALFNEPNAPVSYPFLWDIAHSDYVQWNGIARNAGVGPLGRNAGEVTGVFATLDWKTGKPGFDLGARISGQKNKSLKIEFDSSIDLINLQRLESHLSSLKSPLWPEDILGKIDHAKADKGHLIFMERCESCHMNIDRNNWDRIVIAKMMAIDDIQTDPRMAQNSVDHQGMTGNFKYTYQGTSVGELIISDRAPVAAILTATTSGVVATPDPDKWFVRRWLDWIYVVASSLFDNDIKASIKQGSYAADTTSAPFQSLLAYKGRSLNGIWATAPYLHNGSVPSLYDLLLPVKRDGDPEDGEYRPTEFRVGSREFDPKNVGFRTEGYEGFLFQTNLEGNLNSGHEYAAGLTALANGKIWPALDAEQRWQLVEYMKTL